MGLIFLRAGVILAGPGVLSLIEVLTNGILQGTVLMNQGNRPVEPAVYLLGLEPAQSADMEYCLAALGFQALSASTCYALLALEFARPCCIVLDLTADPERCVQVLEHLLDRGEHIAVVAVCSPMNLPLAVRAMQRGAITVFEDCAPGDKLLATVSSAVERDRIQMEIDTQYQRIRSVFSQLSTVERSILELSVHGNCGEVIAQQCQLPEDVIFEVQSRLCAQFQLANMTEVAEAVGGYRILEKQRRARGYLAGMYGQST